MSTLLFATTIGQSVEVAGLVAVALALVKSLEKAWDWRMAGKAKDAPDSPLHELLSALGRLEALQVRQTEAFERLAVEMRAAQAETNKRLEHVELQATRVLDRLPVVRGTGGVKRA